MLVAGCSKRDASEEPRPPTGPTTIYAVNYPLAYFAERLAPKGTEVRLPVPAGVDPAFWNPEPEVIAEYQGAGLILLNGAGYARWTRIATLPRSRTVVTAKGCRDAFPTSGQTLKHQHGPDGEHAHEATAFTTWLDMRLALCQAAHIRDAVIDLRPEAADEIRSRFAELERDLLDLDDRLRAASKSWGGQPVLASHPVYQYLADAYSLRIESLHFEPDQPLGAEDLSTLDAARRAHRADLMLWEGTPLEATEAQLRDRGISIVVFDPTSQPPEEGDFLTAMEANVERLGCAMGSEPCP